MTSHHHIGRLHISLHGANNANEMKSLGDVAALDPAVLELSVGRDDWEESHIEWPTLTSVRQLSFKTPYCRPGFGTNSKLLTLLRQVPNLQELQLADGLYCYEQVFASLDSRLQVLHLRDSSHHVPLDLACCQALAKAIDRMPMLRSFQLYRVRFADIRCWDLIADALASRTMLEDVQLAGLSTVEQPHQNFAAQAMRQPWLQEQHAVNEWLHQHRQPPFTMADRVEAILQVHAILSSHEQFAQVVRRPDLAFELLRHARDPTVWATAAPLEQSI